MNNLVSIVIPAFNEEGNIGLLVSEISERLSSLVQFEIVLVDDCSSDGTFDEFMVALSQNKVRGKALKLMSQVGQSSALYEGVKVASGDYIITLDADRQNDPADIPAFLIQARTIGIDDFCIIGNRKRRIASRWKKFQSRFANAVRDWLLKDGVPDSGCGLKMLPRATFNKFPYFDHMHRYIPALVKRMGGDVYILPVNDRSRGVGTSKYTAWNRAWVGISDVMGVAWLIRRSKMPHVVRAEIHQGQ